METRKPIDYLGYCGLYCKMCSLIATTPKQAKELFNTMKDDGWEHFGSYEFPEFNAFWEILKRLSRTDETSTLCRGDCGDPECKIRICARSKSLEVCSFCDCFPCTLLTDFTQRYPFILENGYRIKDIGLELWLTEQEALAAKGVTNRDLCSKK